MSDNLRNDLSKAVQDVTKGWKKQKRHADKDDRVSYSSLKWMRGGSQRITLKEVAFEVMEQAYNHASSNGQYYANARQIMYATRPLMLAKESGFSLDGKFSIYFTQTLLKDYLETHRKARTWRVVWDARGHLIEPYTNTSIGLGGVEVIQYTGGWTQEFEEIPDIVIAKRIATKGPVNRFGSILFIEKEGFAEILRAAEIGKKYDMAIMSTKGLPVKAACDLGRSFARRGVQVYVLHDFDLAGFKILRTLRRGTRMAQGTDVVDLGLRMKDIQDLESEPVEYRQRKDPRYYLAECGATEEEYDYLVEGYNHGRWLGRRVEINAMTSEQLLLWLETELKAHGIKKVMPDKEILTSAYQRAKYLQDIEKHIGKLKKKQKNSEVPYDLQKQIKKLLKKYPAHSWDEAVWRVARGDDEWEDEPPAAPEPPPEPEKPPTPTRDEVEKAWKGLGLSDFGDFFGSGFDDILKETEKDLKDLLGKGGKRR